jgi:methionyl-tRNA formyltransferase
MVEAVDAGPVYAKAPLSLEGGAEEIFLRISELEGEIVERIAREEPIPVPQEGAPTSFKRRTPSQSAMPTDLALGQLHDFIRMLDAEGYPHAFLDHGRFRLRFTRSTRYVDRVVAEVEFTERESES